MKVFQQIVGRSVVFNEGKAAAFTGTNPADRSAKIVGLIINDTAGETAIWLERKDGAIFTLPLTDVDGDTCSLA